MIYEAFLWTDVFLISYIKWYKFYNNNLFVILESQHGGTLKFVNPNTRTGRQYNCWLSLSLSLSINFLFTLPRCQVIFQWKQNKGKVRKCLKCVREFLRRFDLANGKYLSIFLGVFARITKVTHFAQVINFRERIYDKVHPSKVDKNREPMVFFVCFFVCFFFVFFQNNSKTKSYFVYSSFNKSKVY